VVTSADVEGGADPDAPGPERVAPAAVAPAAAAPAVATPAVATPPKDPLRGALIRYRVMTYIVGSALIVLVCIGVPLQVWAHFDLVAKVEGTIHGYLYLVYLFTAADLARRAHWRLGRILAVVLSGFVPFLAFIVEHRVVVQMRAERAELLAAEGFGPEDGAAAPTAPEAPTDPAAPPKP
jgi:integral membrane protein